MLSLLGPALVRQMLAKTQPLRRIVRVDVVNFKFLLFRGNPSVGSCVASARNCSKIVIGWCYAQPPRRIVRVDRPKLYLNCNLRVLIRCF